MKHLIKIFLVFLLWFGICQSVFSVTPETGWWWNEAESGRGFAIEQQGDSIFFSAYLYAEDGRAVWYTALMKKVSDSRFEGELEEYQDGQTLTGTYKTPTLANQPDAAALTFSSATTGTLSWSDIDIPIKRFIFASDDSSLSPTSDLANPQVRLQLSQAGAVLGEVIIDLDPTAAPITTENFLHYVDDGFYNGTLIHRVMPDFVVQGGGLLPGLEAKAGLRASITNEATNGLKNNRGSVAMARLDDPHSASAQFFFNVLDNDLLNYTASTQQGFGYAVFGQVSSGMDIIDQIADTRTATINRRPFVPVSDIIIDKAELVQ